MVFGLMTAAVLVAQYGEIDGIRARKILEASRAADDWSYNQVHTRLVPDISIVQSAGATRMRRKAFQDACLRDVRNAAYEQVCDAYHVSKKQFNAIVRNPQRAMQFDYVPDVRVRRMLGRQLESWKRKGTLFDPKNVRLKESLANRYGYINPRKPGPPPPSLVIEQLIGPSPLPREFTEANDVKPPASDDRFAGYVGLSGGPKEWKKRFAKESGYVDPNGRNPLRRPSALD